MQKSFTIKNVTFGEGKPVICVPVSGKTSFEVVNSIRELVNIKIQMIEWRVDAMKDPSDTAIISDVLKSLKPLISETVLLFTFRSKKQGGLSELPEKTILELNEIAAQSGAVDMIDLEFFEATNPGLEIKRFQDMGVRIIASHHDFNMTPEDGIMTMLLDSMQEGGADIVKLAVMPNDIYDVLRLIRVTASEKEKFKTLPIVTMSMGRLGIISRITGEISGSCITFGAYREASAPGQLDLDKLQTILDIIHAS